MHVVKTILKYVLGALLVVAGLNHFRGEEFYLKIMPDYIPVAFHQPAVIISGVAEIALGLLVMVPLTQWWAAVGIIALLVAVFPANIYMYQHQEIFSADPSAAIVPAVAVASGVHPLGLVVHARRQATGRRHHDARRDRAVAGRIARFGEIACSRSHGGFELRPHSPSNPSGSRSTAVMANPRQQTRREFVARATGTLLGAPLAGAGLASWSRLSTAAAAEPDKRLKVAAVITTFTHRSHAHVILENFLVPYLFNGRVIQPNMQVASLYVDQIGAGDMSRDVARQFDIGMYPTIDKALCLGGSDLAVDAVLSIGEHGSYPVNAKAQMEYPRKRFFDEIVAVFKRGGHGVPVFNDKHLSYRWDWAKEMVDTARAMKFGLMAGSSVPLAQRRPPLELPAEARIESAVSIHGGGVESYDIHALEVLQSMVEARRGGETGVREVQFLDAEPLWQAAESGLWSTELAAAAMAAEVGADHELTKFVASRGTAQTSEPVPVHGILVHYRDGLPAIALKVGNSATRWNFACRLEGEKAPRATSFYVGPWQNRNLFKALSHAIQTHFRQGKAPYPVERTLLTTGILDRAMDSRVEGGKLVATPELDVVYTPQDFRAMREMGASWKIITEDTPEHEGIKPAGIEQAS